MMKEGEDKISDDDEVSFNKKRTREEKEAADSVRLITIFLFDMTELRSTH